MLINASVNRKKRFILALSTGGLLVLSWPPISITPLLFVAFVPLLYALNQEPRLKFIFLLSYASFFLWSLGTMYWIANTQLDLQGFLITSLAFLLIPFFQTIPIVLFFWVKDRLAMKGVWWLLPFFWIAYEYLHSNWELAFTWLNLGLGLTPITFLLQIYEFTGPLGGSLFIWLLNISFFLILIKENRKKRVAASLVATGIAIIFLTINGMILLKAESKTPDQIAKIAIVQSNQNAYAKLDRSYLNQQLNYIDSAVQSLDQQKVDLVVFSEGFLRTSPDAPLIINNPDRAKPVARLKELAREHNLALLVGFVGFKLHASTADAPVSSKPTGDGRYYSTYNGALFVTPDEPTQIQIKNNLVPFMERVPYLESTSLFENFRLNLNQSKTSYAFDDITRVFEYKSMKIAPLICLDALFPDYTRRFFDDRVNVVAIIANDSWAGKTSGYVQNASYSKMLAPSLRKSVIRAGTSGISMYLDRFGRSLKATDWNEQTIEVEEVSLQGNHTIYIIFGDILGKLAAVLVAVLMGFGFIKTSFFNAKPNE